MNSEHSVFAEINAPGRLIFRSNKTIFKTLWRITHQNPSVSCTPPFEESPIKPHRFCVLPPLKNHPSKLIGFVHSPLWKIIHQNSSVLCTPPFENQFFWWALISGWAFISTNKVFTGAEWIFGKVLDELGQILVHDFQDQKPKNQTSLDTVSCKPTTMWSETKYGSRYVTLTLRHVVSGSRPPAASSYESPQRSGQRSGYMDGASIRNLSTEKTMTENQVSTQSWQEYEKAQYKKYKKSMKKIRTNKKKMKKKKWRKKMKKKNNEKIDEKIKTNNKKWRKKMRKKKKQWKNQWKNK